MKPDTTTINNLMSKYNLTKKDLFSFCICAVNFFEYYEEECMGDVMYNCPSRYYNADSNNTKAVAGALTGEKKDEGWTDEEQFSYYMKCMQAILDEDIKENSLSHFLDEYERFEKVYKREIMIPIMLGCPVEDYDDTKFDDADYIESIINPEGLIFHREYEEKKQAEYKAYKEKQDAALTNEVEKRKDDSDFSVLLVASTGISMLEKKFDNYNKKFYPDRDYKIISLKNPIYMIIQTGGKSIEEVKERILNMVKSSVMILGREPEEELLPVEKVSNVIPKILMDNKVKYVVSYI